MHFPPVFPGLASGDIVLVGTGPQAEAKLRLLTAAGAHVRWFALGADGADSVDWSGLADPHATVVVYRGLSSATFVQKGLIDAGRDPKTPVAVLARGTRPDSKAAVGRLEKLSSLAVSVGEEPALLVIGEVVARSWPCEAAAAAPLEVAA